MEDSVSVSISDSPEQQQQQQQPLLRSGSGGAARSSRVAFLLGRATGRRSGPSVVVRDTAALQLEERRADWAYSRPVVALDISWNIAFAAVTAVMLFVTVKERPMVPLRVWVGGYALQCVVHAVLVWAEYSRRRERGGEVEGGDSDDEEVDGGRRVNHRSRYYGCLRGILQLIQFSSFAKRCESLNTLASFLWWIIGFYWVVSGGDVLQQDAPRLYWLTVVFLAFDVFFAIFCVALACLIGIALCCCLPCIIAILYAVAGQEGASDADIGALPRYRYAEPSDTAQKIAAGEGAMIPITNASGTSSDERLLLREDAECCICLTSYQDGVELHSLPCNHHFHSACIIKWLRINATCPLCKYNILKGNDCA